jgi:hypothetical protein
LGLSFHLIKKASHETGSWARWQRRDYANPLMRSFKERFESDGFKAKPNRTPSKDGDDEFFLQFLSKAYKLFQILQEK